MKVRSVSCPYCKIEMKYRGVNYENLAKTMQIAECTVPYMIYVEYYECPQCGKIELFHDRRNMKSRDDDQPEAAAAHAQTAAKPAEAPAPAEEKPAEKKAPAKRKTAAKKTASAAEEKAPAKEKKTAAKKTASKTASKDSTGSKKKKSDKE
jgi:hypothetical protein